MRRRIGSILVLALLAATFTVTPWRPDAANAISTSFADGTFQDFDAGTNQDVAIDNDGLTLGPDSSTFNEGSLPAGWTFTSTSQSQPGYASVANGKLTVSGGVARSGIYLRPGQSLTFQATFGNDNTQQIGFAAEGYQIPNDAANVGTGTSGTDRINYVFGGAASVALPGTTLRNQTVTMRIDWGTTRMRLWKMNGTGEFTQLVDTTAISQSAYARGQVYVQDKSNAGTVMTVDSINVKPFSDPTEDFNAASDWWCRPVAGGTNSETYSSGVMTQTNSNCWSQVGVGLNAVADIWAQFGTQAQQWLYLTRPGSSGTYRVGFESGTNSSVSVRLGLPGYTGSTIVGGYGTSLSGVMHHYRIEWYPDRFVFSVPDVSSITPITVNFAFSGVLVPMLSNVQADSYYLTSLAGSENQSGDFTSRVFDAGTSTQWQKLTWAQNVPANTTTQLSVRTGNTATPDGTWSSYQTVANSGDALSLPSGQYAQYKVAMTSTSTFDRPNVSWVSMWPQQTGTPPDVGDATTADFSHGTYNSGAIASTQGDGGVTTPVDFFDQFDGPTTHDPRWSTAITNADGYWPAAPEAYADGVLTLDDSFLQTTKSYGPGTTVEVHAKLTAGYDQRVGFRNTFWRTCACNSGLSVVTYGGSDVPVGGDPNAWHYFRIDHTATYENFYLDGQYVTTLPVVYQDHNAIVWDSYTGPTTLQADWAGVTTYTPPGSFSYDSRIIDGQADACFASASWNADVPAGTSLSVSVRSGNTPTPDASWTSFTAVSGSGGVVNQEARFVQYHIDLGTTQAGPTPLLQDITLHRSQYGGC